MKYWLFDGKDAQGPYEEEALRRQPGFSPDSLVCPDGTMSADQWKPASAYLAARPVEPARPPEAPRPPMDAPRPPMEAPRPPMEPAKPSPVVPAAAIAGESPEAIRLRKAQELPARRKDPEPDVVAPPPPPAPGMSGALKTLVALSVAAAVGAAGWFGLKDRLPAMLAKKAAPQATPSVEPLPAPTTAPAAPAADEGKAQAAVDFARDFPLQSRSRARPAEIMDVFAPKRWKSAATLRDLYDQRALEWLAKESLATLERQGHGLAQGDSELRRSPSLWKQHAQRFLAGAETSWAAAAEGAGWKVTVTLGGRPSEPKREFLVDLAARTIKPVGQASWFDLDPKQAAKWGDRYLRISEASDNAAASPQTPVYAMKGAQPAPAAAPVAAKPVPAADEEEYDDAPDPEVADEIPERSRVAEPAAAKPMAAPKPTPAPKPAASKPASTPEAPAESGTQDHKSVSDMSVDELQKYLSRDKK